MTNQSKSIVIRLPDVEKEITISPDWVTTRDENVSWAKEFEDISDSQTYEKAANCLKALTKTSNAMEKFRKLYAKPYRQADKTIKKASDTAREPLESEKSRLQKLLSQYVEAQRRLREEEEKRIEAERQKEIERQQAQAEADKELFGEETEIIEPPKEEKPATPVPKSYATRTVTRYPFEVVNEKALPRSFLMPDEKAIRKWRDENKERIKDALKNDWQILPGVKFRIETKTQSR